MKLAVRLIGWVMSIGGLLAFGASASAAERPNVIVIYCDDLGYGDLGCYGSKNPTPHLDRMAAEGIRFTDFYVSSPVCSASRAALMTGCYHERVGIRGALGPKSREGLPKDRPTMAEVFRGAGYATGMSGKWHLGLGEDSWPTSRGFDQFLGIPYSADMWPGHPSGPKAYPPLPLYRGREVIDADVSAEDQKTLTARYREDALAFIDGHREKPFFYYLAPNMPHVPLFVSPPFEGKTGRGLYADVIAEIDSLIGDLLAKLRETGLDEKTVVLFSSDNGPWLNYGNHSGSAGPLREGKGTVYEGGIRVPLIARWPGRIPAGSVCHEMACTIDMLPTVAVAAGVPLPESKLDGKDIGPLLRAVPGAATPHEALYFYYNKTQLQAMRSGPWKLLWPHQTRSMVGRGPGADGVPGEYRHYQTRLELYNLKDDLAETKNLAGTMPEQVEALERLAAGVRGDLGDTLTPRAGAARPDKSP